MWEWRNYFAFRGRLNRKPFWLMSLTMFGALFVGLLLIALLSAGLRVLAILALPGMVAFFWVSLSINARRLHDRNKSAWWLLLFQGVPGVLSGLGSLVKLGGGEGAESVDDLLTLIALPFSLWALVELGFRKGTAGPNRFGDDPLAPTVNDIFN